MDTSDDAEEGKPGRDAEQDNLHHTVNQLATRRGVGEQLGSQLWISPVGNFGEFGGTESGASKIKADAYGAAGGFDFAYLPDGVVGVGAAYAEHKVNAQGTPENAQGRTWTIGAYVTQGFGNFYANRGMTVVLRALRALPQAQRDKLTVHVFTGNAGKVAGDDQIASFGESLKVRPYVDYLEFLNLCTTMDCLLVNDATTPPEVGVNPFLPSKISDYKGSGRPVWGIVEPGSRLSMEPLTYVSPTDHVSAAVQVLSQIATS